MAANANITLTAHVTLPAGTPTAMINYSGTLDGQGYTISGISNTLFKKIDGGIVKNVILEGDIDYTDESIDNYSIRRKASTLAWDAENVTLENVVSYVDITVLGYDLNVGGLIGYAHEATFTNCTYAGTCTATWTGSNGAVGGIVGYVGFHGSPNVYTNCAFTGTINVDGAVDLRDMYIGGLVGKHRSGTVNVVDFTNTGVINVTTTAGSIYVGGFMGTDGDVHSLTMSGLFDGTINAPEGATVDNFLALDVGNDADISGCYVSD